MQVLRDSQGCLGFTELVANALTGKGLKIDVLSGRVSIARRATVGKKITIVVAAALIVGVGAYRLRSGV